MGGGGGGGGGRFSGTIGAGGWDPFSLGVLYAQAGNGNSATDAGGKPAPTNKPWDKEQAIIHLDQSIEPKSTGSCARYIREAIEAGGIGLDRSLNPAGGRAYGLGPVLEKAGFNPLPAGTPPQKGDVVVIQPTTNHKSGHTAMYNGKKWISDFEQKDFYGSQEFRDLEAPYVMYRRPRFFGLCHEGFTAGAGKDAPPS